MPSFDIIKQSNFKETFRVASIKGQFDLDANKIKEQFKGNLDIDNIDWNVGIIYGASGTGKSTIAKELFRENYIEQFSYGNKSIVDEMPKNIEVNQITKIFNSVGFATVWSWLKTYDVLSTGEKMRVDLARAILEDRDLIVFDEFTSVVNREVAKAGSFAVQKAIRKMNKRFIAVACHSDIIEWLEPDWTFCTDNMEFKITRGLLRRPEIKIDIIEQKGQWEIFRKYHYLSSELNNASRQFVGYINNEPVVFCAVLHFPHPRVKNFKRVHRIVTLPDYQGMGIGKRFMIKIAQRYLLENNRFIITTSQPALAMSLKKDSQWVCTRTGRTGRTGMQSLDKTITGDKKYTYSYEYILIPENKKTCKSK